jgi:superfamily II DNA/RNA helicase
MTITPDFFSEPIKKALADLKITAFTEVQKQSFPLIMNGDNLIAASETGSGKTLAFILPLIEKIQGLPKRPIRVLVISPTKELSDQTLKVVKQIARHTNILSMSIYGGKSFSEQERDLKKGFHLIVACPGRLQDHIEKNTIDLSGVEYIVLDEADQLMDLGFMPQIEKIMNATPLKKQVMLFSATINEEVKILIKDFLGKGKILKLNELKPKEIINELFCPIKLSLKYSFLRFLLKHKKIKAALIFTNTKEEARILGAQLIADNYPAVVLEGDMTSHQRQKSLVSLKSKNARFLIATDVASRGIDIPHLTHVINYTIPLNFESYIHRVGRTARFQNGGEAITLFAENEIETLEALIDKKIIPSKFSEFTPKTGKK